MGAGPWDKISGTDSKIHRSVTHLEDPTEVFVLHRDLSVSLQMARRLSHALTRDRFFRHVVPKFLRRWSGEGDKTLLESIAELVENGDLSGTSNWRFGVTPIPLPKPKRGVSYWFEIRLIVNLDEIFPSSQVARVATALRQKQGSLNRTFIAALGEVINKLEGKKHGKSPAGGARMLREAFLAPVPPPVQVGRIREKKKK